MERRDLLRLTAGVATVSTTGLAGCTGEFGDSGGSDESDDDDDGENGDDEPVCATPGESLADSLPDSPDYEMEGEPSTGDGEDQEDVEASASAFYTGPDDGEFIFAISEYSGEDAASDAVANAEQNSDNFDGAAGFVQTGAYIFVALGPDEDSVTVLMKASPTLSGACVDSAISFLDSENDDDSVTAPSVAFSFDWTASTEELTITHTSGETVEAGRLYIRGDFDGGDGNDSWLGHGGTASSSVDGNRAVSAGDFVTVQAGGSYEIQVVWETGSNSATLSADQGPEA